MQSLLSAPLHSPASQPSWQLQVTAAGVPPGPGSRAQLWGAPCPADTARASPPAGHGERRGLPTWLSPGSNYRHHSVEKGGKLQA